MTEPHHILVPLSAPADWEAALSHVPHTFAHTWVNCHAMHLTTGYATYLYCFAADGVRIACPVAERSRRGAVDLVTPYGFSGFTGTRECPEFPRHWREFAASRGYVCAYIGLNPLLFRESYADASDIHQHNSVFCLDLSLTAAALSARMSAARRRELRRAQSRPAEQPWDKEALARFFIEQYAGFLARQNASAGSYMEPETLRALFEDERVLLVGAGAQDHLEAVSVFAHTDHIADFLFNVSVGGGQRHSATLIWEGAMQLKARGVSVLNLGGGIRQNDGVAEFKRRFGGTELPLRSVRQVFDPRTFASLCRLAGTDPADISGYFPPYHAR